MGRKEINRKQRKSTKTTYGSLTKNQETQRKTHENLQTIQENQQKNEREWRLEMT